MQISNMRKEYIGTINIQINVPKETIFLNQDQIHKEDDMEDDAKNRIPGAWIK